MAPCGDCRFRRLWRTTTVLPISISSRTISPERSCPRWIIGSLTSGSITTTRSSITAPRCSAASSASARRELHIGVDHPSCSGPRLGLGVPHSSPRAARRETPLDGGACHRRGTGLSPLLHVIKSAPSADFLSCGSAVDALIFNSLPRLFRQLARVGDLASRLQRSAAFSAAAD